MVDINFEDAPIYEIDDPTPGKAGKLQTHAVPELRSRARLYTADFTNLIALCLAVDPAKRPALGSIITSCINKVNVGRRTTRGSALNYLRFDAPI